MEERQLIKRVQDALTRAGKPSLLEFFSLFNSTLNNFTGDRFLKDAINLNPKDLKYKYMGMLREIPRWCEIAKNEENPAILRALFCYGGSWGYFFFMLGSTWYEKGLIESKVEEELRREIMQALGDLDSVAQELSKGCGVCTTREIPECEFLSNAYHFHRRYAEELPQDKLEKALIGMFREYLKDNQKL